MYNYTRYLVKDYVILFAFNQSKSKIKKLKDICLLFFIWGIDSISYYRNSISVYKLSLHGLIKSKYSFKAISLNDDKYVWKNVMYDYSGIQCMRNINLYDWFNSN